MDNSFEFSDSPNLPEKSKKKEIYFEEKDKIFKGHFINCTFENNKNVSFDGVYEKCLFFKIDDCDFKGIFIDCKGEGGFISNSNFSGRFVHSRHWDLNNEIKQEDISAFSDNFHIKKKCLKSTETLVCPGFEASLRDKSKTYHRSHNFFRPLFLKNKENREIEFLINVYLEGESEKINRGFRNSVRFKYVFIPLGYYQDKIQESKLDRALIYFPSGEGWINFLKRIENEVLEFCKKASGKRPFLDETPLKLNVDQAGSPIGFRPIRPFHVPLEEINPDLHQYFK
ncbi:MAG: hypothetical protein GF335_03945 [Candidatus Moranbacteria bacterium]|nr:hypothetical protein [Candidatus Moranbacteria bacterium]